MHPTVVPVYHCAFLRFSAYPALHMSSLITSCFSPTHYIYLMSVMSALPSHAPEEVDP